MVNECVVSAGKDRKITRTVRVRLKPACDKCSSIMVTNETDVKRNW